MNQVGMISYWGMLGLWLAGVVTGGLAIGAAIIGIALKVYNADKAKDAETAAEFERKKKQDYDEAMARVHTLMDKADKAVEEVRSGSWSEPLEPGDPLAALTRAVLGREPSDREIPLIIDGSDGDTFRSIDDWINHLLPRSLMEIHEPLCKWCSIIADMTQKEIIPEPSWFSELARVHNVILEVLESKQPGSTHPDR